MFWVKIILLIVAALSVLLYAVYHLAAGIIGWRLSRRLKRAREQGEDWVILTHEAYECGMQGEYEKQIQLAEKAIELNPGASEARRLIGNSYEFLGDEAQQTGDCEQAAEYHQKATEAWNRAKEINPKIMVPGYRE